MPPPPPPMNINEWWFAAAAATFIAPTTTTHAAPQPGTHVGTTTAVRPGVVAGADERIVYIGHSVPYGEKFKTDSKGVMHILFLDQSSMTLGPNSELVINEFVFDPDARRGSIAVNLVKGALRVVGGFISKFNSPQGFSAARVQTATATIGIRGGISLIDHNDQNTSAVFLFGNQMMVSGIGGQTQNVTRPGFGLTIGRSGELSQPTRTPSEQLTGFLQRFGGNAPGANSPQRSPLISTNGNPLGNSPGSTFAPDRTQQTNSEVNTHTPSSSLRHLLGTEPNTISS